jgi:hypothetical protein
VSMPRPAFAARKVSTRTNNLYQNVTTILPQAAVAIGDAATIGGKVGSAGTALGAIGSVIQVFSGLKVVRWWMVAALSGAALAWYSHGPGDPIEAATKAAVLALWS